MSPDDPQQARVVESREFCLADEYIYDQQHILEVDKKSHGQKPVETTQETKNIRDNHDLSEKPNKYEKRLNRLLTPKSCRWDPKSPPPFTTALCILYALVSDP